MTREQLATLSVEEIKAHVEKLQAQKKERADVLVFQESVYGKRWAERKTAALAEVRDKYGKIKSIEQPAEVTVRELLTIQAQEAFLKAEIAELTFAKDVIKKIDDELRLSHSLIEVKEKASRSER